ncbi:MAG: SufS family cysteine desulfurase [Planctomycetota bacterium]
MSMSDVIGTNGSGTAAEEIGAAAARLARDAIAAAAVGGMAPPTAPPTAPVPAPMIPSAAGQQVDTPLPTGMTLPSGLLQPHGLPQQPREAAPATHHHSVQRGTTDWTGLRRFVSQVRGLDHRQSAPLPAWQGAGLQSAAGVPATAAAAGFDVDRVRLDFPILQERIHGHPLAWFDNAATTHKPQAVIDALVRFYATDYSNIHRGAHTLAARATEAYESSRSTVAAFLGAAAPEEILFVRGCTEGINFVANILAPRLHPGDEIVLLELEHHANIVPWQMVAQRTGAVIRVAPIDDRGEVIVEAYARLLGPRTRLVSMSHASNSLGTIVPVELLTALARAHGATVVVDGAQSVSHFPVDVRRIGCDFYVFSGHKIFGPTGIGAVYGRGDLLATLPPWQGGGNMIRDVSFERTTYADPPARFEAGTPSIADAVGLAAALDYVTALGRERIAAYEHLLLHHATRRLEAIDKLRLVGTARDKVGVLSFVLAGHDPVAIGQRLDRAGIAVRAGHHCAQPSLRHFGLEATVRPSLAFYNTVAEIDRLADVVAGIAAG